MCQETAFMVNLEDHEIVTIDRGIIEQHELARLDAMLNKMASKHNSWMAGGSTKRKIMVFAHGGLVDRESAESYIQDTAEWWLANNVYPIYFVWQSGAWDSFINEVRREIEDRRPFALANVVTDIGHALVNAATEEIVREIPAIKNLWDIMKDNAYGLSRPYGGSAKGGLELARALRNYQSQHPDEVEIHLVGHSAGCIVHAAFVNELVRQDIPIKSLTYVAPANRVDEFVNSVYPLIRTKQIESFSMYYMGKQLERDDRCKQGPVTAYYGSLLWLVSKGFEYSGGAELTPILGMQYFLERQLSGIPGPSLELALSQVSNLYFSKSADTVADSHGGFASERITMDSIAMSIVKPEPLVKKFPTKMAPAAIAMGGPIAPLTFAGRQGLSPLE
jgi:hypothetical protein